MEHDGCELQMYSSAILKSSMQEGKLLECFKIMNLLEDVDDFPHLLFHLVHDLKKIVAEISSEEMDLKINEYFRKAESKIANSSEYV
tara:strand:+ start:38 stop:298 length:261 start_codon:yes stop_codon:yes gene_type:complete